MNNGLVNDAIRLCVNIHNALPPNDRWAIINIAKTSNQSFTYPTIPEIPTGFGYSFDRVPDFLKDEGVIAAEVAGRWYQDKTTTNDLTKVNITIYRTQNSTQLDSITQVAREKGYFKKDEKAYYYQTYSKSRGFEFGPKASGQYAVLVDIKALCNFGIDYLNKETNQVPTFNVSTGVFSFLGESVDIKGEIAIASMGILVQKINSRLSKKEFYEIRKNVNYESDIVRESATKIDDILEKTFRALKAKIGKNSRLHDALFFGQDDGFGIFVNQKALIPSAPPQIGAENSPNLA